MKRLLAIVWLIAGGTTPAHPETMARSSGFHVVGRLAASGAYRLHAEVAEQSCDVSIVTDAKGDYQADLPLDPAAFFVATNAVTLKQTIYAGETLVATLPEQRIGFAPYALHADAADRCASIATTADALTVGRLTAVKNLVITNVLAASGTLIVTNAVAAPLAAVASLSRLVVGTRGSSLAAAEGWFAVTNAVAAYDGVFELQVPVAATSVRLDRTGGATAARSETLVNRTGLSLKRPLLFTVPVRAGDTLTSTLSGGEGVVPPVEGVALGRFIYFGLEKTDS